MSAVVEKSDDAIIPTEIGGTITSWNRGAERLYGYEAGEMIGRRIALVYPDSERHVFEGIFQQITRGERPTAVEGPPERRPGA